MTSYFDVTRPLSLYIHFPWCLRKCPYCDFNSHTLRSDLPEEQYVDQLLYDLKHDLPRISDRQFISIFMGGGTPSLFSAKAMQRLLDGIDTLTTLPKDIEITIEANPGTVEQNRFQDYRDIGINRLSLGIQSFNATHLKKLGRIHTAEEAKKAITMAQTTGFSNFNLDLMYALPMQTIVEAIDDIKTAIAFQPQHISWYQLTIEPNTLFYKQPPPLPSDDDSWSMQQQGHALLAKHGYHQYEISAYSRLSRVCQHNKNYWQFGDYLGIGAGAHSKVTDIKTGEVIRFMKVKHPQRYLQEKNNFHQTHQTVSKKDIIFEFMLNALRLQQMIPFHLFQLNTGLTIADIEQPLKAAQEKELLRVNEFGFEKTALGARFLNELMQLFLV